MSDFIQRLKEEISDLKGKLERLTTFLSSDESSSVKTHMWVLLKKQERLQAELLMVLEERLKLLTTDEPPAFTEEKKELDIGRGLVTPIIQYLDPYDPYILELNDNDVATKAAVAANSPIETMSRSGSSASYDSSDSGSSSSDSSSSSSSD